VAAFAPSDGFNCTVFRTTLPTGPGAESGDWEWVAALAEAPNWDALRRRPSFFGNPLLAPFAYGIADNTLRYGGAEHVLSPTRWGRVAHGLVRDAAWTVERTWEDAAGAHVRAVISTAGEPKRLAEFPYPFKMTATYSLTGRALTLAVDLENLAEETMPFGFGLHPYLPAPLGTLGRSDTPEGPLDDVVRCDATHVDPSGQSRARTPHQLSPVAGRFDLRQGRTFADLLAAQKALRERDGLFLTYAKRPADDATAAEGGSGLRWSVECPHLGTVVEIEAGPELTEMVLFAPPAATCISPVIGTCLPGFLDYPDDPELSRTLGRLELAPQQTWSTQVTFRVRPS
jgi:galactose mutarotase-like enzyme